MKRFIALALAIGFGGASAWASNLNVSVKSGGLNAVTVLPNTVVNFQVEGILSDDLNEGLALVGFDLHFTGGALASDTIAVPVGAIACGNPMPAFVKPDGITNPDPAGYRGTLISGDLVQVGGGQNTIKNSVDNPACAPNCAPFPIGAVLTGVAQPAVCGTAVIATGSLTAPAANGSYQLQVLNLFANVIKDGETGATFFATVAAGQGTNTPLTINVNVAPCGGFTSTPPNCAIDARQPHLPGNSGALQGWNSVAMTFDAGCNVTGAGPGDFTIACTPAGACPTISNANAVGQTVTVALSSVIPAEKWTCITHTATTKTVCLGSLPADANGSRTSAPADILDIIDNLNGVRVPPLQPYQCDLDRIGGCAPADILTEIDLLNGANGFLVWNGKNLPVCPSAP
jgi:hypothetical protein